MKPPSDAPHLCLRYLRGHETSAPELSPRTWYGMPAYAKSGKVVCFFQGAQKLNKRYSTLGFNDAAYVRHKVPNGLHNNASEVVRARRGPGLLMLLKRTGLVLRRMREAVSWIEADIDMAATREER